MGQIYQLGVGESSKVIQKSERLLNLVKPERNNNLRLKLLLPSASSNNTFYHLIKPARLISSQLLAVDRYPG